MRVFQVKSWPNVAHLNDVSNSTAFSRLVNCLIKRAKLARLAKKSNDGLMTLKGLVKISSIGLRARTPRCFYIISCLLLAL